MGLNINFNKPTQGESTSIEDRSFKDLTKSKKKINVNKLFQTHEEVFYKIPKIGKKSHTSIILDSQSYINNYVDPLDTQIKNLVDEIEVLANDLEKLEQPDVDANPFFPNETFITFTMQNTQGLPIWIMINGLKREFKNYDTYVTAKIALGFDESEPDINILQEADEDILESIPSGDDIKNDTDLVTIFEDKTGVIEDLDFNLDIKSMAVQCLEKGTYDNNGECSIKYYDLKGQLQEVQLMNTQLLTDNPNPSQISRTVGPRLKWQPDPESSLQHGLTEVKGYTAFYFGNDTFRYNEPTAVELGGPPQYSDFGTRMFTKMPPDGDGYTFDDKGEYALFSEVLSDPKNPYYNQGASYYYDGNWYLDGGSLGSGTDVYGAPILRYNNQYIVELRSVGSYTNVSGLNSRVWFLYLTGGSKGGFDYIKKHSKWKDKGLHNPKYDSNSNRLKYWPARVNSDFNGVGYTFNANGKSEI